MANTVIAIRSSGVTGNIPTYLEYGELSINYADGIIYYRTDNDTLGSIYRTLPAGLDTEVQFNNGGTFSSSANLRYYLSYNDYAGLLDVGYDYGGTLKAFDILANNSIVSSGNITTSSSIVQNGVDLGPAITSTLEVASSAGSTANTKVSRTGDTMSGDLTTTANLRGDLVIATTKLFAGIATEQSTELPNVIAQFSSNSYTYTQVNQQNIDGHGSADFVVTADVGDDLSFYTDVGMSGSEYNFYDGYDTPFEPLTGYFLVQGNTGQAGGNMIIGTTAESTNIRFLAGGFESSNVVMEMDNDGVTSTKVLTAPTLISTNISTTVVSATANVYADQIFANNKFWAGSATANGALLPDVIAQFTSNSAFYTQVNQQNINENGSADYVLTADVGDDENFYIDVGINNSQLTTGATYPLDGYLIVQGSTIGQVGGNLVIGTISETPGQETRIIAGGGEEENVITRFTETGVIFEREIISDTTDRIYAWANAAYDAANTAGGNAFTTISAVGFDDVIANTKTTKLTIIGQTGIAIGTDASNSTISIATNLIGASNVVIDFGTVTDILGAVTFDYGYV